MEKKFFQGLTRKKNALGFLFTENILGFRAGRMG
jgi:hypothetical protein